MPFVADLVNRWASQSETSTQDRSPNRASTAHTHYTTSESPITHPTTIFQNRGTDFKTTLVFIPYSRLSDLRIFFSFSFVILPPPMSSSRSS